MADDVTIDCSASTIITKNVTIAYGTIYAATLLVVSIYSFHFLFKYNPKFIRSSFGKKIIMWLKDVWKRRRCYVPLITHIFDQVTDITVAIQFYELAVTKSDNDYEACGGLNIWYLFILTILSMVIYRVISSYLVYKSTHKSLLHLIFQLLDIELFRALYINYLGNKTEPCDPQRFITAMEASLESAPQALIQMIYLVKTNTFDSSIIILVSFLSSLWSIITKLVSDDKIIVVEKAKRANVKFGCNLVFDLFLVLVFIILIPIGIVALVLMVFYTSIIGCWNLAKYCCCKQQEEAPSSLDEKDYALEMPSQGRTNSAAIPANNDSNQNQSKDQNKNDIFSRNIKDHYQWISWWYVLRYIWRILDVSGRIFICTLCWMAIGGVSLTVIISVESVFFLALAIVTKQAELLFGIVALVISLTDGM